MSTSTFRSLAVGLSIFSATAIGAAQIALAQLVPGDPLTPTQFAMTFDENGHALINGEPVPFAPVTGGGINYFLPVAVVQGSVNVFSQSDVSDINPNGFSDRIDFSNTGPNGTGVLFYRSLLDDASPPDLADVLNLVEADTGNSVQEIGPEGNNSFVLGPTPNGALYNGISDVPEPSTLIMGGLALVSLAVIALRRRSVR